MKENNRDSNRIGLVIDIKLTVEGVDHIHKTRNISDHGVFLEHNTPLLNIELGTHVILQVCSMLGDAPAPPVNAEVARITADGIGLQFIL